MGALIGAAGLVIVIALGLMGTLFRLALVLLFGAIRWTRKRVDR
jgi:hypothetical protein